MQLQTKLLYNTRTQPKEYNKKDSQQSKQTPERIMQEDNKETAALGGGQVGDSDIEAGQQQQQRQQQQQQQSRRGTMAEGNGVAPVSGDLNQPQQQQEKLFGNVRETKVVWILKLSMVVLLTVLAIVGAAVIYFVSHDTEVTSFEEASHDHAHKVLQGLGSSIDLTLGAVDSFVVSLSNYADASNSTWPFVTLPNHAIQFAKLRSLAKAFYLCLVPLVTLENRPEWEEYTVEHGGPWVEEDLEMQKKDYNYHGIVLEDYELNHKIYTTDGDAEGPGPVSPKTRCCCCCLRVGCSRRNSTSSSFSSSAVLPYLAGLSDCSQVVALQLGLFHLCSIPFGSNPGDRSQTRCPQQCQQLSEI